MNNTSDFTSGFWPIYITVIVVASIIFCIWLLLSQSKSTGKKGAPAETLGHVWDEDLQEYNNPLPRWWMLMFVATIIFSIIYLALYPGIATYQGALNWTSQKEHADEVALAEKTYKPLYDKYMTMSIPAIAADPEAKKMGQNLFNTYCIQCHGSDGKGSKGFPNLTDNDWLGGGSPEQIHASITNGRMGVMAAWGEVLGTEGVKDAAHYVMSLSGKKHDAARAVRGKEIYFNPPASCVTCHGEDGKGNYALGAPNLTDDIWLWGGSEKAIMETIANGRINQMPTWSNFIDDGKIQILTAYVWGLSNNPQTQAKAAQGEAAPK